uniref:Uncharacterized protein n=1 Tax=Babesia bovis TaxID=5865 RepID=S6BLL4_BABBO|nr:hypothetical protein [Babesia bovis]
MGLYGLCIGHRTRCLRAHHTAAIRAAYELSKSKSRIDESITNRIAETLRDVRGCTLSNQEAFYTLDLCLRSGIFQHNLFHDCLSIVEADYFNPVLIDPWNGEPPLLQTSDERLPRNSHCGVNGMSIEQKASLIVCQDKINAPSQSDSASSRTQRTTELDPEKHELFTTKKLGKVLDPKPFKVRVNAMVPGKKLCNTVALQLKEAIRTASSVDITHLCSIFVVRRPFSGTVNDDAIDMLTERLLEYTPEQLFTYIHHLAIFCSAAASRATETWSYDSDFEKVRSYGSHRTYRIRRTQLPKRLLVNVSEAVDIYASKNIGTIVPSTMFCYGLDKLEQHVYTMRSLAMSDVPISMATWDGLMSLVGHHIEEGYIPSVYTVLCLLEAINASKYTTSITNDVAHRVISCCTVGNEALKGVPNLSHLATYQILRLLCSYTWTKGSHLLEDSLLGINHSRIASFPSHIRSDIKQLLQHCGRGPKAEPIGKPNH